MDDVRKIAEASHDDELLKLLPEVEHAKDELMGLHIRAGYRLTELLQKELRTKSVFSAKAKQNLTLVLEKSGSFIFRKLIGLFRPEAIQINRLLWDMGN